MNLAKLFSLLCLSCLTLGACCSYFNLYCPTQAWEEPYWVQMRGEIEFISTDGQLTKRSFESWASRKPTKLPFVGSYDPRRAGDFACRWNNNELVLRVDELERIELQGDQWPIVLVKPGGQRLEAEVGKHFVDAIARMDEFRFTPAQGPGGGTGYVAVPSTNIRTLVFFKE